MTVLAVAAVSESLRGRLSRWMLEIGPGIFVGRPSARVADAIWSLAMDEAGDGWAAMARTAATEQGFALRWHGESRRETADFDGLTLVRFALEDPDGDGVIRGDLRPDAAYVSGANRP